MHLIQTKRLCKKTGGNNNRLNIPPGKTVTLAKIKGPGAIHHIWVTIAAEPFYGRKIILRMFWDGEDFPSVEAPISDFFGVGHSLNRNFSSIPISCSSEGRARNCYSHMPFCRSARITATNEGAQPVGAFYNYIDYRELSELPQDTPYFHTQYRQEMPCQPDKNYVLCEASGRGHYVGCNLQKSDFQVGSKATVYRYLSEPHKPYPSLPSVEKRIPFDAPDMSYLQMAYPPEKEIDFNKTCQGKGNVPLRWKKIKTESSGFMRLENRDRMTGWKSHLHGDATLWLLEDDNPSVKYLALKEIMEAPESHPEVQKSGKNIMKTGVVPKILARQAPGGYWEKAEDFYIRTKYRGTVWTFILLAELMASAEDQRIRRACEFILDWSQDRESGGFSYRGSKKGGGNHSGVLPCLTGNMTWGLIRFGYLDDPRVRRAVDWITTYQRFDDGDAEIPKGWPYDRFEPCWGKHTCIPGMVKGLKALGEVPPRRRTKNVEIFIQKAIEFLLKHHVYKKSHNLTRVAKPKWAKLWFPWMWDTDVLEMLVLLTELGCKDHRMQEAVELLLSKQGEHGRWPLENTYNGRFQANIERKGKSSKWITLNALRVLKRYYG